MKKFEKLHKDYIFWESLKKKSWVIGNWLLIIMMMGFIVLGGIAGNWQAAYGWICALMWFLFSLEKEKLIEILTKNVERLHNHLLDILMENNGLKVKK